MNKIIDALTLAEEALRMISTFQEEDNQCDNGYGAAYVANEALAAIREALAEQEKQEPVAIVDEIGKRLDGTYIFNAVGKVDVGQPLYAAPVSAKREWVGPTPQDVYGLIREGAAGGGWQGFASRLSAWLKEKNNG